MRNFSITLKKSENSADVTSVWPVIEMTLLFPPQVNDQLMPRNAPTNVVYKTVTDTVPEHTIRFMENKRTGQRGLVFTSFIGQSGTFDEYP